MMNNSTSDYQIIGYEFANNTSEAVFAIQKFIDENGGRYIAEQVAKIIDRID